VKLGIIPAVISPLRDRCHRRALRRRYMLTAERFSAAEAYRIGLLHEMVTVTMPHSTKPWARSSMRC
jgi:methylglutaconyl-CoA hydratase